MRKINLFSNIVMTSKDNHPKYICNNLVGFLAGCFIGTTQKEALELFSGVEDYVLKDIIMGKKTLFVS